MTDITNPDYYKDYKIEVTDAIIAWKLTYSQGNIIKYIVRAGKKDSRIDDLNKALWYLKKEIGIYERQNKENTTRYSRPYRETIQKYKQLLPPHERKEIYLNNILVYVLKHQLFDGQTFAEFEKRLRANKIPREDINAITMAMRREKNDRQDRLQSKKRKT